MAGSLGLGKGELNWNMAGAPGLDFETWESNDAAGQAQLHLRRGGNPQSIASSNPNGASMSYTYDNLNRLSSVTDKLGTTAYSYDGASNVGTVAYPNGVKAQYMYDPLNRVTGLGYTNQSSSYVYTRDSAGRLTNASEPNGRTVTWSFDGINRLTGEAITGDPSSQSNGTVGYTLDPVGNRLSDTSSLAAVPAGSWNYNADDELGDETYDQDGNVTAADGKTFGYDSQNELVSMNGTAVQMVYDGDGNRVAKAVTSGGATTTTQYLVDDLNPTGLPQVMDELTNGVVTRTYTYGLRRISEDQVINNAWTPSFYSYDGMGSVRQLTNISGTVTDSYEYDAYGNSFTVSGTTPNEMMYRGEQYDSDLGLYYLRARYYNPITGRFMSRDPNDPKLIGPGKIPIDPRMLHKYLYAEGDPVDLIDPRGRASILETGSLDLVIARTTPELLVFGGAVTCAFGVDAYAISLLNGGDWMDNTLNGAGLAAACALAGLGYLF